MTPLETVKNRALSNLLNLAELVEEKSDNGSSEMALYRLPVRDEASESCTHKAHGCRHQKLVIAHYDFSERLQIMETAVFILPEALEWRKPRLAEKIVGESIDDSFMLDLRVQEVMNETPSQEGSLAVVERELLVRHREVVWQGVPPANATRQLEEITDPEFKDLLGNLAQVAEYHLPRVDIRLYEAWQKNSFNECHWPDSPSCPAFRLLIAIRDRLNVWNNRVYILPKAYGGWQVRSLERFRTDKEKCGYRLELDEFYLNVHHDPDDGGELFLKRPKVVCVDLDKAFFE
ncbi:MAG: hypothetical protein HQM01_11845 [Magnetococcales bacterium]|nr:hypothetical protein [Magnetococcales bacterium]